MVIKMVVSLQKPCRLTVFLFIFVYVVIKRFGYYFLIVYVVIKRGKPL